MKVILDECLPRRLLRDLSEHLVTTVPRQGWAGKTNGALIELIEPDFDVFITMDSNIVHQQNLAGRQLSLIVLHGPNSRYETIHPLIDKIRNALSHVRPGTVVHITH